jgi:hypothetical protein
MPSIRASVGKPRLSTLRLLLRSRRLRFGDRFARVGPTTPMRAGRLADASVDPTNGTSLVANRYQDWTCEHAFSCSSGLIFRVSI